VDTRDLGNIFYSGQLKFADKGRSMILEVRCSCSAHSCCVAAHQRRQLRYLPCAWPPAPSSQP